MTTTASAWTESSVDVAGLTLPLRRSGGDGPPLLLLPHETGGMGPLPLHDALARDFDVIIPTLPGYDGAPRPEWMRSVRDMAVLLHTALDEIGLMRCAVVGFGFGGWLAAEMATMNPHRFSRLVLAGAMGLLPAEGEILDQFLLSHQDYVRRGFHDPAKFDAYYDGEPTVDQLVALDLNREMTARIAWKPYMYSQTLAPLLAGLHLPALVVWGDGDGIVPLACAHQYVEALPDARLMIIPQAGHFLDIEQPEALTAAIQPFLSN